MFHILRLNKDRKILFFAIIILSDSKTNLHEPLKIQILHLLIQITP